jgi:hypothetical protein
MKLKLPKLLWRKADPFAFFKKSTLEAFNFLTTEYGFEHVSTSEYGHECDLTFWNQTTEVSVDYELGGGPSVSLGKLERTDGKTVDTRLYPLRAVVAERCPENLPKIEWGHANGKASEQDLHDALHAYAALLKEYAGDMLGGDFGVVPALKKRTAEFRRQWNKEVFGTYSGESPRFSARPTLAELFADAKSVDPTLEQIFGNALNQDKTGYRAYQTYWDYEYPVAEIAAFLNVDEAAVERMLEEQDERA